MASSLIKKRTVRGDSSIADQEEEIAAPPADIQSAVAAAHAKLHGPDHTVGGADAFTSAQEVNFGKVKTGLTTERYTKSITTNDETPTDIDAIAVAEGEVVDVEVNVMARKGDGSERAVYHLEGVFYRNASGDVTQEGKTASLFQRRSTSAYEVDLVKDVVNQTVDVKVTGVAATTIKWEARLIVTRLQS